MTLIKEKLPDTDTGDYQLSEYPKWTHIVDPPESSYAEGYWCWMGDYVFCLLEDEIFKRRYQWESRQPNVVQYRSRYTEEGIRLNQVAWTSIEGMNNIDQDLESFLMASLL